MTNEYFPPFNMVSDVTPSSEWIEWTGGECPVNGAALVHFQMKNEPLESVEMRKPGRAEYIRWNWIGKPTDIVAYRLASVSETPFADRIEQAIISLVRLRVALVLGHTAEAKQLAEAARRAVEEATV